jgi:hypothetical protein
MFGRIQSYCRCFPTRFSLGSKAHEDGVTLWRESANSALQRTGTQEVLGRGRPSAERTRALRARVLTRWRAAAELGS